MIRGEGTAVARGVTPQEAFDFVLDPAQYTKADTKMVWVTKLGDTAAVAVGVRGLTLSGRAPLRPLPAVLVAGGVAVLPPVVTPLVVRAFVVVAPSDRHGAPTPRRRAPCAPGRGSRGRWRGTSAV